MPENLNIDRRELSHVGKCVLGMRADRFVFTRPDSGNFSKVWEVKNVPPEHKIEGVAVMTVKDAAGPDKMLLVLPNGDSTITVLKYTVTNDVNRGVIGKLEVSTFSSATLYGGTNHFLSLQIPNSDVYVAENPVIIYVDNENRLA